MLKTIHIQNYRGIKDLEIKDFKRINLFVGDNNSGKTSVLEAITILQPKLKLLFDTILFREVGGRFLVKAANKISEIGLTINLPNLSNQFYEKKIDEPFAISSDFVGSDRKLIKKSLKASLTSDYIKFDQPINNEDQSIGEINSFVAEYRFGKEVEKLGLSRNGTGKIDGKNFGSNHVFISDIPPKSSQLIQKFSLIIKAGRKSEYVKIMKEFEPELEAIDQAGEDLLFGKEGGRPPISISYMGSGFVRFLDIFLTIDQVGNNSVILCIDEIDNGLHHSKQEYFWKIMFAYLKRYKNLQIFATTHSYEAIAALSRVFEESGKKDLGKDEIRLFTILKDERGINVGSYKSDVIAAKTIDEIEVR